MTTIRQDIKNKREALKQAKKARKDSKVNAMIKDLRKHKRITIFKALRNQSKFHHIIYDVICLDCRTMVLTIPNKDDALANLCQDCRDKVIPILKKM